MGSIINTFAMPITGWMIMTSRFTSSLLIVMMLISCVPSTHQGGFNSPDPATKLHAIHQAGETHDTTATTSLVEQLDSDDPAIRMMSIQALERITGTRLNYNPYAPAIDRQKAIHHWVAYVQENTPIPPKH